jgi:flagellar biosynthesis protein FlhG
VEDLRKILRWRRFMIVERSVNKHIRTIAVTSGKGGVGKTNIVANLAIAFRRLNKEVMIMDADLGLSNIDIIFNIAPKYNINHVINGQKDLKDVIVEGPLGIKILPASSGIQELTSLDEFQRLRIIEEFDLLKENIDVLLIDTAAGISSNVAFFCTASQEIIVVTNPEPTAITDAYALIKVLFTRYQEKDFRLLVNSARNSVEAFDVFKRLSIAVERFLNISIDYLGFLPFDKSVQDAVRQQIPFMEIYPECAISKNIMDIALKLIECPVNNVKGTLQFFIGNLLCLRGV